MAKVKFGGMVADARGKLDGVVYSKNQYGAYVRNKVSPVQPQTARQTLVRERLATLSKNYATVLTDAQRAAWSAFAKINPSVDIFGQPQAMTGIGAYCRLGAIILNTGAAAPLATPPADLQVSGLIGCTVAAAAGAGTLGIVFGVSPLAAGEELYIYATQGFSAGRQFFKPALRFIGCSPGAQVTPYAAGPQYVAKFGAMIAGTAIGVLVMVVNVANGALSPGIFNRVVVAA